GWRLRAARRAHRRRPARTLTPVICDNFLITAQCAERSRIGELARRGGGPAALPGNLTRLAPRPKCRSERRIVRDARAPQVLILPACGAALTQCADESEDPGGGPPQRGGALPSESADPVRLRPGPIEAWSGGDDGRHCPAPLAKAAAVAMMLPR